VTAKCNNGNKTDGNKAHILAPDELFKHSCNVVIPLQETKKAPTEASNNLPDLTLGTKSSSVIKVHTLLDAKANHIEINTRKEKKD
jgi:hypothetical protein